MYDLHCHILPGVDDGAADLGESVAMARALSQAGFTLVVASPHAGEGPGGDVSPEVAAEKRAELTAELERRCVGLKLEASAEHVIGPLLFERIAAGEVVPIGGRGRWLFVELPWGGLWQMDQALFRLQAKGYRLLLAHPERHDYLDVARLAAFVSRGVRLQLELGSFSGDFGPRARKLAQTLAEGGLAHVLATDLHHSEGAADLIARGLEAVERALGKSAVCRALVDNPRALLENAEPDAVASFAETS
jgi:protein-tyrosine phosphatase